MRQFLGIYSTDEAGETLMRILIEAEDIADAVATVASRIPADHCLQTVVGDDPYCWQRGVGFVEASAEQSVTIAGGGQQVAITVAWQNVSYSIMEQLVEKLSRLIIEEMRKWK